MGSVIDNNSILILSERGNSVVLGQSEWFVVSQLYQTGSDSTGYEYVRRNYIWVYSRGSQDVLTSNCTASWYSGTIELTTVGTYAEKDEYLGKFSYGSTVPSVTISAQYTGGTGTVYKSSLTTSSYAIPCKLTLDGNGGTFPQGTSFTLTYGSGNYCSFEGWNIPTRTGYKFQGLYTAKSGGTQIYNANGVCIPGTSYWNANSESIATKNYTLYAQWTANTYTVTFNANGGTLSSTSKTVTYDSAYGTLPTGTKTGHNLKGFYTAASGGTQKKSTDIYTTAENSTLYAQWTPWTHTVAYSGNGATSGSTSNQTKTYGTALTLRSNGYTKTGYTFQNWNTKADGSGTSYAASSSYTRDQNGGTVTLYAIWKINTYDVVYDANGGINAPSKQTKTYGANLTLHTSVPSRAGYFFVCWNTSADNSGTKYSPGSTYTENKKLTLYAIWEPANVAYCKINDNYVLCNTYYKKDGHWYPAICYMKYEDGKYKQSVT